MRCNWAIKFGVTLHTRCAKDMNHDGSHVGPGLREFPYQSIQWYPNDRREYQTNRDVSHAWEE